MLCAEDGSVHAASSVTRAPEIRSRKGVIRKIIALESSFERLKP
jgi:hypothetical protein